MNTAPAWPDAPYGTDVVPVSASKTTTIYNGDRTTMIPPTGGTTQTTFNDPIGRTSELDQYTGAPTVHAAANLFTGISYLTAGAVTKTTYGYDGHGNQNKITDSRGQITTTTYDQLNRKTAEYNSVTQTAANKLSAWVYDNSDGAVAGMTYPLGHQTSEPAYWGGAAYTTQYKGFNVFGESTGETVSIPSSTEGTTLGVSYAFTHQYSTNIGLLTRDIYPAAGGLPAESITHGYTTALELPDTIGGYDGGTAYDAYSRVQQVTLNGAPNQAFVTDTYDQHTGALTNQLVTSKAGTAAVATLDEQIYGYDADPDEPPDGAAMAVGVVVRTELRLPHRGVVLDHASTLEIWLRRRLALGRCAVLRFQHGHPAGSAWLDLVRDHRAMDRDRPAPLARTPAGGYALGSRPTGGRPPPVRSHPPAWPTSWCRHSVTAVHLNRVYRHLRARPLT